MPEERVTEKRERKKKHRGLVFINAERCKGCAFCVAFCPFDCLALASGFNSKGYHPPELVKADLCNGCDLCGLFCPDFAIFGVREKLDGAPEPEGRTPG